MADKHSVLCVEEADDVVRELREALGKAGVVLPSLRIDLASIAREKPCPHVELGGCSVDVARRLARVVAGAVR
ncbi:hypothetical protein [Streptomyces malaysiense]|uniref:Uncharacterized protein n=1 Tax=Streptomyces malaysiense TaxID=1428626 RepID=A0A1J4PXD2_9ACTN|nr:hypothetical protein [Streptomyces malaysiense]OIK24758.1 hypothetical protein VT52_025625 [Streptomyces malaysiense]